MLKVPFVDLARQYRALRQELMSAFDAIGESGVYIMGERLESFERKAASYCQTKHAIGAANGSDAIFLVLKALGIGAGDEVITCPNSFIATAWTVVAAGARPVFVDAGEDMNMDPARIESAITARTRAIIPVHLTGRPAPVNEIARIARERGLYVIEDAAQAIGARYHGKRVGSLGDAGCFSLHPLKNLGVYGDGGLITTDDEGLASKLRLLRNHGLRNRDECEAWAYNSRLDPLQAAFAEIKLAYLDGWNARCREIAAAYREGLRAYVQVPEDRSHEECVYHNFVIRTPRRDELRAYLLAHGVDTRVHYPIPIHMQDAAKSLGYGQGDFPNCELFAQRMVSLPVYPELSAEEVGYVIDTIMAFHKGSAKRGLEPGNSVRVGVPS
ncbi:MAG: DegT/DnrJ/EryC1/StrS family aminotransferase [Burkholderiales bacterium]